MNIKVTGRASLPEIYMAIGSEHLLRSESSEWHNTEKLIFLPFPRSAVNARPTKVVLHLRQRATNFLAVDGGETGEIGGGRDGGLESLRKPPWCCFEAMIVADSRLRAGNGRAAVGKDERGEEKKCGMGDGGRERDHPKHGQRQRWLRRVEGRFHG